MKIVIAEQPSIVQAAVAVLGARQRGDGYIEGGRYAGFVVLRPFGGARAGPVPSMKNTRNSDMKISVVRDLDLSAERVRGR